MAGPARRYEPSQARAAAIRRACDWAHMSERDLATALGVSRATVRAWQAAERDPGPDMTARIAVATRTRVSSLLMPGAARRAA
jgi:DNA-binding transcriptional regulator YiaG